MVKRKKLESSARLKQIRKNYLNPRHPTAYSGITKLQKFYNISRPSAHRVLKGIKSYSLHRETKKPKVRNCYFIYSLGQQIQADLIDIASLSQANDQIRFLFAAIDMFSRKLVCLPMKNKTGRETARVMKIMIDELKPKQIFTDSGKEFLNFHVEELLANEDVTHQTASSDLKCAGVERVNKTIQRKLYQYMTEFNTDRYIDVLSDIVHSYNSSIHSSTGLSPYDGEKRENHFKVLNELNKYYTSIVNEKKKPSFQVGDIVRISKLKDKFLRSYKTQNKEELFEIQKINTSLPIPMYYLKSMEKLDEPEGGFYSNELTLFSPDVWEYVVEKPPKKRTYKGVKQVYAKWVGFNETYHSWIPESYIVPKR